MTKYLSFTLTILLIFFSFCTYSQENKDSWVVPTIKVAEKIKEDKEKKEEPSIFKFEPDYLAAIEKEKTNQAKNRAILDTLSISEGRKKRLLKKIFKKNFSEDLSRVVETKFED
ncbi:hypothetical protein [uncultured Maribacter sp.]|uniref:hypothetical protein n=1 Tax=uncultured Maribacter sp. TaxID=431308 RepID=UPI00260CA565|nr:hypothetical protein [uncultured Maribacter sp.]